MSATNKKNNYAYTTLITKPSYLAGVIILAYTLRKQNSQYPLVVLYTDALTKDSVTALQNESEKLNLVLKKTEALLPRSEVKITLIAERFGDTWTKLRHFELTEYDTVCYLDADMAIYKNMDTIFDNTLPSSDWIAANHACVCNLDKDAWAPSDWTKENCAYTLTPHPQALTSPTPVTPESRPTHHLLNSGMFLYKPSTELWERMLHFFNTSTSLGEYKFPDQDFLADFFKNKWMSVGWQFNALKTMRYWHPDMWRDDEVRCLHYIVDKPWSARVSADGTAGYLGRDGETHTWWWNQYQAWVDEREKSGRKEDKETVEIVAKYVAKESGEENEHLAAVGGKVQSFASNKPEGGWKS